MRKLFYVLPLLGAFGCSSLSPKTEDLMASEKCTVWKGGALGSKIVTEVNGEMAKQKETCWVMDMFGCSYTEYTFKSGTSEILSSLPPADKTIAKLERDTLSVSMTGITVPSFKLNGGKANYTVQGPIGPKQNMTVEYNKKCTVRQAALGLLTMIAK